MQSEAASIWSRLGQRTLYEVSIEANCLPDHSSVGQVHRCTQVIWGRS